MNRTPETRPLPVCLPVPVRSDPPGPHVSPRTNVVPWVPETRGPGSFELYPDPWRERRDPPEGRTGALHRGDVEGVCPLQSQTLLFRRDGRRRGRIRVTLDPTDPCPRWNRATFRWERHSRPPRLLLCRRPDPPRPGSPPRRNAGDSRHGLDSTRMTPCVLDFGSSHTSVIHGLFTHLLGSLGRA